MRPLKIWYIFKYQEGTTLCLPLSCLQCRFRLARVVHMFALTMCVRYIQQRYVRTHIRSYAVCVHHIRFRPTLCMMHDPKHLQLSRKSAVACCVQANRTHRKAGATENMQQPRVHAPVQATATKCVQWHNASCA